MTIEFISNANYMFEKRQQKSGIYDNMLQTYMEFWPCSMILAVLSCKQFSKN